MVKIFECKRGKEDWEGALIVGANNDVQALNICKSIEIETEFTIKPLKLKLGLIYNDFLR
jgi:hypothetical protein